ncbi:erg24, C-14 sterol reductase [Kluyveromyces marxianus]|nr:erg24, C-14 sterol reductase [Kluyveromyces marxianus]KAG0677440.1 erg24, C-14 sterol reductase [Kluyveromyces marxianus]
MSTLNPRTTHYEFSGPIGALAITVFLPALAILLNQMIRPDYYIKGLFSNFSWIEVWNRLDPLSSYLFNGELWTYYTTWYFSLALLDVILPGTKLYGVELRDGSKLPYKINGISMSAALCLVLAARYQLTNGEMPELEYLYTHQTDLCIITILFSFALATAVYIASFIPLVKPNKSGTNERILALGGNSGNVIYDWFIGRELNPRLGPLDIKLFSELRPGMLLWLLLNLSCLHHSYKEHGKIIDSLLLINVLQGFYIFDGVLNEEGVLTMMDITTDGFGFMLAFGDLCLVPFTYCLQARYLSVSPIVLGPLNCGLVVSVMLLGYWIFHSSNKQKSEFRQGNLPHMKSIQTERGTKLLCDSWWAVSQHINYFGDLLISLSWCLCTGFQTPLTYYYFFYFTALLLHRQTRDEDKCRKKYGKSWEEYEKKVPYKIIPYVY